jgi:hypothetical protein
VACACDRRGAGGGPGGRAGDARARPGAGRHAARLSELQSRIRPHFLFNTLNSAIALVRAEPAKAETLLEDLSDLFRHALIDQGESVTLADEIELAQRYLAIEQVRFGERLQLEWALDPRRAGRVLPPCCCSRWSRTRCAMAWSPASRRHGAHLDAAARLGGADQGHQHRARRQPVRPAMGWRWTMCATACACCMMCRGSFAAAWSTASTRCASKCRHDIGAVAPPWCARP